jgi:hypothetical protein
MSVHVRAQRSERSGSPAPLVLTGAIPLPEVKGRIDHFGFDPTHNRLFVSVLGNNTEEVIGLSAQSVTRVLSGVPAPQGVVYSPGNQQAVRRERRGKALYLRWN